MSPARSAAEAWNEYAARWAAYSRAANRRDLSDQEVLAFLGGLSLPDRAVRDAPCLSREDAIAKLGLALHEDEAFNAATNSDLIRQVLEWVHRAS